MELSPEAQLLIITYLRKWLAAIAAGIIAIAAFTGYSVIKSAGDTAKTTATTEVHAALYDLKTELKSIRSDRLESAKEIGKANLTKDLLLDRQKELERLISKTTGDIKKLEEKKSSAESLLNTITKLDGTTSELALKLSKDPALIEKLKNHLQPVPTGTIISFSGSSIDTQNKDDWMLCDGRSLNMQEYKKLWNVIGQSYGGDKQKKYFNIPDMRGRFIRGVDQGTGNDPDSGSRVQSNVGGNTGDHIGSIQNDATKAPNAGFVASTSGEHSHGDPTWNGSSGPYELATINRGPGGHDYGGQSAPTSNAGNHTHRVSGGDSETRPKNIYVNFFIKVR